MRVSIAQSTTNGRRLTLAWIASMGGLALSACSNGNTSNPKASASATFFNIDKVRSALEALSGAVDNLESAVGGFDSEDWKDVVPQVKTSATDVADTLEKLKQIMAGNPNS